MDSAEEHVVVELGGSRFALPMASVAEVGRPPELTRVPGLPEWVAGVANWRGRVLAVLDLRPLLGGARSTAPLGRTGRLVVVGSGVTAALLVDRVEGTVPIDLEHLEPAFAHLPVRTARLLAGQRTDADGPCGVLDLAAVLALADELPRARRAG